VGGLGGFVVSFLVFPSRAHALTTDAAADTLELVAAALSQLLEHHCGGERPDIRRINAQMAVFLTRLNATGAEAEHERTARLTSGPDTGPLLRTLLRLRHDIVILGRAVGGDLPEPVQARLNPPLGMIAPAVSAFLRQSGAALRARVRPPPLEHVEQAFAAHSAAFDAVRRDGLIRGTPSDMAERFFALGFALEQMREHLGEVHRVVGEWARA
jgi:hypothetical protein